MACGGAYVPCIYACQVRVTEGDSGLRCFVLGPYLERCLTPLCVDSTRALWASFCFRFVSQFNVVHIIDKQTGVHVQNDTHIGTHALSLPYRPSTNTHSKQSPEKGGGGTYPGLL